MYDTRLKATDPQSAESTRKVTSYIDERGCADIVLYQWINVGCKFDCNFCVPVFHEPISFDRSRNCMGSTMKTCVLITLL
jgi:hypothetical protein